MGQPPFTDLVQKWGWAKNANSRYRQRGGRILLVRPRWQQDRCDLNAWYFYNAWSTYTRQGSGFTSDCRKNTAWEQMPRHCARQTSRMVWGFR